MALYTFQGLRAADRLAGKTVVADTSYLIAISDPDEKFYQDAMTLHEPASKNSTKFIINVIIRQEFLKQIRKIQYIQAILQLSQQSPQLDSRYKQVLSQNVDLTAKNLKYRYEDIYKDHVQKMDCDILFSALNKNVWDEVKTLEAQAGVLYLSRSGSLSWDDLGELMSENGLSPADGMITNFALKAEADAIVTTDCDYAQVADIIDVYMPAEVADTCDAYDITLD